MVGTAVTVDALDATGRFLGGLILPGFGLMLRALEMGTAGLKAPTGEVRDFPTNIVAGILGFKPAELFELVDAADRAVPVVDLGRKP